MTATPVVTRFAPSPTGHLHIGGVRTALFCWAFARRHGGRFVLRIEDTDQKRSSDDAAAGILEDLAWLGIGWDDGPAHSGFGGDQRGVGPFYQAERLEIYRHYLDQLLETGRAYPAFESGEELDALRAAAQERKESFRYSRRADYDHEEAVRRMRAGEPCVIRFRMPDSPVDVTDAVLGQIQFDERHTDDFVIRKADGFPTYHFAVVVDDELMGVTHVLRGQEHLNNTPRHVALQQALRRDDGSAFRVPVYAHMPLIFNADGSKMSKRDKDKAVRRSLPKDRDATNALLHAAGVSEEEAAGWLKDKTRQLPPDVLRQLGSKLGVELPEIDLEDFRRTGYPREVLCNYLALLGWNPGLKNEDGSDLERFDAAFLSEHFSLERIGKSNAKFDRDKLAAFSQDTIAAMSPEDFYARLAEWCRRYDPELLRSLGDRFEMAARAIQPRVKTLSQCREPIGFALIADDAVAFDEKAVAKGLLKGEPSGLAILGAFVPTLERVSPFEPDRIEAAVREFCESNQMGMGKIAQPIRVAITGSMVSPGLGETLALVGREGALERIDRCLRVCGAGT